MPTDRSSNTEVRSVPRELLETIEKSWRIPNGCPASISDEVGEIIARGLGHLRAILTQPADQRQSEPDDESSEYVFNTGPYQVELTEEQWRKVFAVFDNYSMGDDRHFVFLEEHGRGLISEILIELGLAPAVD
jgi:hypothetical protein